MNHLLLCLPAPSHARRVFPDSLLPPELPPHLQVTQPHHHQGDQVGQDEVDQVVAGTQCYKHMIEWPLFFVSPLFIFYFFLSGSIIYAKLGFYLALKVEK